MQKWKVTLVLLAIAIYATNAIPTFDVLYKIAGALENELLSDSYGPRRDPYRTHQPGYGPPSGSVYYPPHSHTRPSNTGYPAPYPSPYPGQYPGTYPAPYPASYPPNVGNPTGTHYPGPYPAVRPPHGQYPSTNYISGPYDEQYPRELGNNGYGAASGSNYGGGSYGYKRKGY